MEANRCLFCYDAPCTHACPTHINIPGFIKKIATENMLGSAKTILESNLLGATCARVCPVQELCEGACVLGTDHKPIAIGRLQRYAMDYVYGQDRQVFQHAAPTGKRVAVVGAGPAGLSCAGELAKLGHSITVFDKRDFAGGLSTYGIISLREPVDVSLAEVEMIRRMGVHFRGGAEVGRDIAMASLQQEFEAIFLSIGLGKTPALGIPGENFIQDGLEYIERSKIAPNSMTVGRNVIVVGAGNTAIDCATIAKRLGAEQVTIVYRRSNSEMSAYPHEYEFAKAEGLRFQFLTQPVRVLTENGQVTGLECMRMMLGTADASGRASPQPIPHSELVMPADQIVKAIGQKKSSIAAMLGLATKKGYIAVDQEFATSIASIYAGGDCIRANGAASTVMAVQDGKMASKAIHHRLTQMEPQTAKASSKVA